MSALENAIRKLAEERPDFVYTEQEGRDLHTPCGYAGRSPYSTEGEGCIVGQALASLGVDSETLLGYDGSPASVVIEALGVEVNADWAALVQSFQDEGFSWGDAVESADRRCGKRRPKREHCA